VPLGLVPKIEDCLLEVEEGPPPPWETFVGYTLWS